MAVSSRAQSIERYLLSKLTCLPLLNNYVKTHGWPYILAWFHRISGILLVGYLWLHLYTLRYLLYPDRFDQTMAVYRMAVFMFLEWLLAIPMIYHALNGGRLILYEFFGNRNEAAAIRGVIGFSAIYAVFIGFMMLLGSQNVSETFYWLGTLVFATSLCGLSTPRIWHSLNPLTWKFQRLSGVFLLLMAPAHLLFMHLQPSVGHEAGPILQRLQNDFIRFLNIAMLVAVLYHGSYGLYSLGKDYIASKAVQLAMAIPLLAITIWFAWIGIRLMLKV